MCVCVCVCACVCACVCVRVCVHDSVYFCMAPIYFSLHINHKLSL